MGVAGIRTVFGEPLDVESPEVESLLLELLPLESRALVGLVGVLTSVVRGSGAVDASLGFEVVEVGAVTDVSPVLALGVLAVAVTSSSEVNSAEVCVEVSPRVDSSADT